MGIPILGPIGALWKAAREHKKRVRSGQRLPDGLTAKEAHRMVKIIAWLVKLPPLAGYRSKIGLGILAATGIVTVAQGAVGWLAGPNAADLVAAVPVLGQVIGFKAQLAGIGTWLALVGAAFLNESPRNK